jgi:polar amino acid transport system substrate-binding protein
MEGCTPTAPKLSTPPADDKLAEVLERGTLVISTDPEYPPQSKLDKGATRLENTQCAMTQYTANQFKGFDVDTAVEIARRLGVEPCFVTPQWDLVVAGGWADRWDLNVGSMSITQERAQALYFAQPYTAGSSAFFIHRDNTTYQKPTDLDGKRIGVCGNCYTEFYLEGTLSMPGQKIDFLLKHPVIRAYQHDADAMQDLAAGDGMKLDAVLADTDETRSAIEGGLPLKQLGDPVLFIYISPAIDKNSSKDPISFVRKISEIVQAMHADGTLSRLSQKYYGFDYTQAASKFDISSLGQLP